LEPIAVSETSRLVLADVNLYHTSSSGFPVAQTIGMLALAVAPHTVPLVLITPLFRVMAPEHSSLPGGAGGGI